MVVDALLGTGIKRRGDGRHAGGDPRDQHGFPLAKIVAIDLPSGMPSDRRFPVGESVRADYTVTFTALKVSQALAPNCDAMGELSVAQIGSPPDELLHGARLSLVEPAQFRGLLAPRARSGHKGDYGHVLVIGGRAGRRARRRCPGWRLCAPARGWSTVACSESATWIAGLRRS